MYYFIAADSHDYMEHGQGCETFIACGPCDCVHSLFEPSRVAGLNLAYGWQKMYNLIIVHLFPSQTKKWNCSLFDRNLPHRCL